MLAVSKSGILVFVILQMHPIFHIQALTTICTDPIAPGSIDQPASTLGPKVFLAKGTSLIEHVEFSLSPDFISPGIDVHELVSFALTSWDSKKCTGVEVVKSILEKSSDSPDDSLYSVVTRFYPNDPRNTQLSYHDKYPDTKTSRPMRGTSLRFTYQLDPANPSKWVQQIKASWTTQTTQWKDKKPVLVEAYLSDLLYVNHDNFVFNPMPVNSFMFSLRAYSKNSPKPIPGGQGRSNTITKTHVAFENLTIILKQGDPDFASAIQSTFIPTGSLEGITHDTEFKHWSIKKVFLPKWKGIF